MTGANFPGWTLDPTRNQYYYFFLNENADIYQSGERIPLESSLQTRAPAEDPQGWNFNPERENIFTSLLKPTVSSINQENEPQLLLRLLLWIRQDISNVQTSLGTVLQTRFGYWLVEAWA